MTHAWTFKDITGQKFGRLFVKEYVYTRKKFPYYLCECDCGVIKTIRGGDLKSGCIKSCGCLNSEKVIERNKEGNSEETRKKLSKSLKGNGFKTGRIKNGNGYILLYIPGQYPNKGKYKLEHRIIAEKVVGRTLKRNEIVHHINGNKSDNRNCNLLICSLSYHAWLHMKMSDLYMKEKFK